MKLSVVRFAAAYGGSIDGVRGGLNQPIPWWAKIAAKIILSRLPFDYGTFAGVDMFRHGDMDREGYALDVVRGHLSQASLPHLQGSVCLELGPGDAVSSALVAHALGAQRCYLVDVGAFASEDMALYRRQAEALARDGFEMADISSCENVEALLQRIGGEYLTDGLNSLRALATHSVDFMWSQAVLEHVRLAEFDATLAEMHRILAPDGIASHRVDLKDHLAGSLHNLRFKRKTWERDWFAGSGFYTNRIRFEDMVNRFERAGFATNVTGVDRWAQLPLAKQKLDQEFSVLDDTALCVSGFDVVLRP